MRQQLAPVDARVAAVAARQHGVVTFAQLIAAGLDAAAVRRRVRNGRLFRVYRGVYRVGHVAPSTEAQYLAAVLAVGDGALLAGPAAAHLWQLTRGPAPAPLVLAPRKHSITGLRVKRDTRLDDTHGTTLNGIPVTTPARTLVSLAASSTEDALARAVHEATVKYRTAPEDIEAVLERIPNANGAAKLRRIIRGETRVTLSRLEKRFLALLSEHDLLLPETNKRAGGRYVDCRWPAQRLTVELDSYRYHGSRHAWEQDRRREREARARGDDFRRYTSADVFEDPRPLLRELRPLIPAR